MLSRPTKTATTGVRPPTCDPSAPAGPPSLFLPGAGTQFPLQNPDSPSLQLVFNKYFHNAGSGSSGFQKERTRGQGKSCLPLSTPRALIRDLAYSRSF